MNLYDYNKRYLKISKNGVLTRLLQLSWFSVPKYRVQKKWLETVLKKIKI